MLLNWMLDNLWVTLAVWIPLYISDYALTLWAARLRAALTRRAISIDGSYELNPYFIKDINGLRKISPRFIAALASSTLVLAAMWLLARLDPLGLLFLELVLGGFILLELTIHLRHIKNLLSFRNPAQPGEIAGSIRFSRRYIYRTSAWDLLCFALFYFVLFLFLGNIFFIGGVLTCGSLGLRHLLRVKREPLLTLPSDSAPMTAPAEPTP